MQYLLSDCSACYAGVEQMAARAISAVRQVEEMENLEHRTHTKFDEDGNLITALVEPVERFAPVAAAKNAVTMFEEEQCLETEEEVAEEMEEGLDDEACSPKAAAIEDITAMGAATQWRGSHIVRISLLLQYSSVCSPRLVLTRLCWPTILDSPTGTSFCVVRSARLSGIRIFG